MPLCDAAIDIQSLSVTIATKRNLLTVFRTVLRTVFL